MYTSIDALIRRILEDLRADGYGRRSHPEVAKHGDVQVVIFGTRKHDGVEFDIDCVNLAVEEIDALGDHVEETFGETEDMGGIDDDNGAEHLLFTLKYPS